MRLEVLECALVKYYLQSAKAVDEGFRGWGAEKEGTTHAQSHRKREPLDHAALCPLAMAA